MSRNASRDSILHAFLDQRQVAVRNFRNDNDAWFDNETTERLRHLDKAVDVLGNDERRRQYDIALREYESQLGTTQQRPGGSSSTTSLCQQPAAVGGLWGTVEAPPSLIGRPVPVGPSNPLPSFGDFRSTPETKYHPAARGGIFGTDNSGSSTGSQSSPGHSLFDCAPRSRSRPGGSLFGTDIFLDASFRRKVLDEQRQLKESHNLTR